MWGPTGYVSQSSISEAARTTNTAGVTIGLTVFIVFVMHTIDSYETMFEDTTTSDPKCMINGYCVGGFVFCSVTQS